MPSGAAGLLAPLYVSGSEPLADKQRPGSRVSEHGPAQLRRDHPERATAHRVLHQACRAALFQAFQDRGREKKQIGAGALDAAELLRDQTLAWALVDCRGAIEIGLLPRPLPEEPDISGALRSWVVRDLSLRRRAASRKPRARRKGNRTA